MYRAPDPTDNLRRHLVRRGLRGIERWHRRVEGGGSFREEPRGEGLVFLDEGASGNIPGAARKQASLSARIVAVQVGVVDRADQVPIRQAGEELREDGPNHDRAATALGEGRGNPEEIVVDHIPVGRPEGVFIEHPALDKRALHDGDDGRLACPARTGHDVERQDAPRVAPTARAAREGALLTVQGDATNRVGTAAVTEHILVGMSGVSSSHGAKYNAPLQSDHRHGHQNTPYTRPTKAHSETGASGFCIIVIQYS